MAKSISTTSVSAIETTLAAILAAQGGTQTAIENLGKTQIEFGRRLDAYEARVSPVTPAKESKPKKGKKAKAAEVTVTEGLIRCHATTKAGAQCKVVSKDTICGLHRHFSERVERANEVREEAREAARAKKAKTSGVKVAGAKVSPTRVNRFKEAEANANKTVTEAGRSAWNQALSTLAKEVSPATQQAVLAAWGTKVAKARDKGLTPAQTVAKFTK